MRIHFAAFVLDRTTRQLYEGPEPRPLRPLAFELLDLLVARRPAAVSKPEIRDRLWPDTFVSDSTLSSLAAQVRRALGKEVGKRVRSVHGFGYAFDGEATEEKPPPEPLRVAAYLSWNRRTIPLFDVENVIGRDPAVAVRIEAPGVSRRHARILASGGTFTLEDLGSKNGTYLGDVRLSLPAELADGDEFRLGQTTLVFRIQGDGASTASERG